MLLKDIMMSIIVEIYDETTVPFYFVFQLNCLTVDVYA